MSSGDIKLTGVIGGKTAAELHRAFGLETVTDLLYFFPRKYHDHGELTSLSHLREGDQVTVIARVKSVGSRKYAAKNSSRRGPRGGNTLTEVVITDGEADLKLTFFNQSWRANTLKVGVSGIFSGKVNSFRGQRQLVNCEMRLFTAVDTVEALDFPRLLPIYRATSRLSSWRIQDAVKMVLPYAAEIDDPLPVSIRKEYGLLDLDAALSILHNPMEMPLVRQAQHRMKFEEAFILQSELQRRRQQRISTKAVARYATNDGLVSKFQALLPFALTPGQIQVNAEVAHDLAQTSPMLRLLQGDVGSGKTIVALQAMLAVVDAGGQAALLAPTEVLAGQHFQSITNLLGPLARRGHIDGDPSGTHVDLLTGSMPAGARRAALLRIASGESGLVIGTHALLSEQVSFADLALVVVDEQHRFGVDQRAALVAKGPDNTTPHALVMTATPIPRTVAMTVFGDLDVSMLRERPAHRAEVTTHVVPALTHPQFLERAWQRIAEEVAQGHQAFIVCPRISAEDSAAELADGSQEPADVDTAADSEAVGFYPPTSVAELVTWLHQGPLGKVRLGSLHGRMSAVEKSETMTRMRLPVTDPQRIDVLVSTTVVEVGVDLPQATLMMIVDAHRFGLSSLHQLRGRIGRGDLPGVCLLVTDTTPDSPAGKRLQALVSTNDGFELSERDLLLRKAGDILGADQSGWHNSLHLLNVINDQDLIAQAKQAAQSNLDSDPDLVHTPELTRRLRRLAQQSEADYLERI